MTNNDAASFSTGDIQHTGFLSENIARLCLSDEFSDVILVVENQRLPAHKAILAAMSEYFRALLFGGLMETRQQEIELKGAPPEAFKALLRYIYSGFISLSSLSEDNAEDIMGLAQLYSFQKLQCAMSEYMEKILTVGNVCAILDSARLYGLEDLTNICHNFMDKNAQEVLQHESFLNISIESLKELLERDSLFAPELVIFRAFYNWCETNLQNIDQSEAKTILQCIRLPLIPADDLKNVVGPFALVMSDMVLDAIKERINTKNSNLRHRGQLIPEENVAAPKYKSSVIQGEMPTALLDGSTNYGPFNGYTWHKIIKGSDDTGIIVKLGTPSIITHIKLLLWDKDERWCGYYIEVSIDQKDWVRVIDHSSYYCRSWQRLYFKSRVVQYIKIVGTNNTANPTFHAVSLEAMHTQNIPPIIDGLVQPDYNPATMALTVSVMEGVSAKQKSETKQNEDIRPIPITLD